MQLVSPSKVNTGGNFGAVCGLTFPEILAFCLLRRTPRPVCTSDSSEPNTEQREVSTTPTHWAIDLPDLSHSYGGRVQTANRHANVTSTGKCMNMLHDSRQDWLAVRRFGSSLLAKQGRLLINVNGHNN